jgi:epoxyqueuosine reductase
MDYLATERARQSRSDPVLILPECKSILVLGMPYHPPTDPSEKLALGQVAAYALGADYHDIIPQRLAALVKFIEGQVDHPVPNRCYTDTGPILERDLAQQAGLGWIGKNTCLINPRHGSTFFLAEILLGIELESDSHFSADHCGSCTRCIEACPTQAILPKHTLDARRCISYLTIENKGEIPAEFRDKMVDWIFGCDICQQVCPWNRFAIQRVDESFAPQPGTSKPDLIQSLALSPHDFNRLFKHSPIKRSKRHGYLRNISIALGNTGDEKAIPALKKALTDPEPLVREHASWAIRVLEEKS